MRSTLEMAHEAGIRDCTCNGTLGCLERFADLVRADAIAEEREACAKWYDTTGHTLMRHEVPDAIRARRSNT